MSRYIGRHWYDERGRVPPKCPQIDQVWLERELMEPWKNSLRRIKWEQLSDFNFVSGVDWPQLGSYAAPQQPPRRRKMTRAEAIMTAALASALLVGTFALFLRLLIMPS